VDKKYFNLLVVDCGGVLLVAKTEKADVNAGDMVEVFTQDGTSAIGEVKEAMYTTVGGQQHNFIDLLHTIHEVGRIWREV